MSYDLVDDPQYEEQGLSVSTCTPLKGHKRAWTQWGVYYHGRLLHPHLSSPDEARKVKGLYIEHVPAKDPRWTLLTTPGKQPSPSTDHIRKAADAA